jgi:hypothetical protein
MIAQITPEFLKEKLRTTELISETKDTLLFIKPKVYWNHDDPLLNLVGKGIVCDKEYNVIHYCSGRILRQTQSDNYPSIHLPGGLFIRMFYYEGKWRSSGLSSFDIPPESILTDKMQSNLETLQKTFTGNTGFMYTVVLNTIGAYIAYAFDRSYNFVVFGELSISSVKLFWNPGTSQMVKTHLDPNSYVYWKLFVNTVNSVFTLYKSKFVFKMPVIVPKKYTAILYNLHKNYLSTRDPVTRRIVGNYIDCMSIHAIENILL